LVKLSDLLKTLGNPDSNTVDECIPKYIFKQLTIQNAKKDILLNVLFPKPLEVG